MAPGHARPEQRPSPAPSAEAPLRVAPAPAEEARAEGEADVLASWGDTGAAPTGTLPARGGHATSVHRLRRTPRRRGAHGRRRKLDVPRCARRRPGLRSSGAPPDLSIDERHRPLARAPALVAGRRHLGRPRGPPGRRDVAARRAPPRGGRAGPGGAFQGRRRDARRHDAGPRALAAPATFAGEAAFLDIETDGGDTVTAIAVLDRSGPRVFLRGRDLGDFQAASRDWKLLVTFNGLSFDVPVLRRAFPGWRPPPAMSTCATFGRASATAGG